MMLKGDLYGVVSESCLNNQWLWHLHLNADCYVYKAHFAGNPITPGACMVEIVRELLEQHFCCEVRIRQIKNIKYLSLLSPLATTEVALRATISSLDEDGCRLVQALFEDVAADNVPITYAKMSMRVAEKNR